MKFCTIPFRLFWGNTKSGPVIAGLIVCGRNWSFCRYSEYVNAPLMRVRSGRFTPAAALNVCAMLFGGSDVWPVNGEPAALSLAEQPAGVTTTPEKHGLSARTHRLAFAKYENP